MEKRREELEAKRAKLAELKRQRELRKEAASNRASMTASPDSGVRTALW
jgi:dynein intermediate chain